MNVKNKAVKPFLRWAGGKNWLRKHLEEILPDSFDNYYEPFLGGGSIFFFLKSKGYINKKSYLSDSNKSLINTYKIIQSDLSSLKKILERHTNNREEYYKIRSINFDNPVERAAQFLYLNKTSFNGIHRVNKQGKYNVPYGNRNLKKLYDFDHLEIISELLSETLLLDKDFKEVIPKAKMNDLLFIDPPYTVAHKKNGFIQYNKYTFSWKDQCDLAQLVKNLKKPKIHFIMTNAYHKSIIDLYNFGKQISLSRASTVGGKGALRTQYKEIIITNENDSTNKNPSTAKMCY